MTEVGAVRIEPFRLQHDIEALRDRAVILDDEYAHPEQLETDSFVRREGSLTCDPEQ